jgi:hypothetical protein
MSIWLEKGSGDTHSVRIHYDLYLRFSYGKLIAIQVEDTNFVSSQHIDYSPTTKRHINRLSNRVVVSPQQFEVIRDICLPKPPPQTKQQLLIQLRMDRVGTHY